MERCSDGGEDQGAEEAFMGQKRRRRIVTSVLERAVSREGVEGTHATELGSGHGRGEKRRRQRIGTGTRLQQLLVHDEDVVASVTQTPATPIPPIPRPFLRHSFIGGMSYGVCIFRRRQLTCPLRPS